MNEWIDQQDFLYLKVHLVREDVIAAGKALQEWGANGEQQEVIIFVHRFIKLVKNPK